MIVGFSVTFTMTLNLVQSNVAGRTKKTIYTSSIFVSYCVGNLIGPQLFFTSEYPRYQSGFTAMIVCFAVQFLFTGMLFYVSWKENQKRDQLAASDSQELDRETRTAMEMSDLTDKENMHFRYAL